MSHSHSHLHLLYFWKDRFGYTTHIPGKLLWLPQLVSVFFRPEDKYLYFASIQRTTFFDAHQRWKALKPTVCPQNLSTRFAKEVLGACFVLCAYYVRAVSKVSLVLQGDRIIELSSFWSFNRLILHLPLLGALVWMLYIWVTHISPHDPVCQFLFLNLQI